VKTLFSILKTSFLTVSAIIGAGFITGRELVGYFGIENFEVYSLVSALLFFGSFYLVYSLGRRENSYNELHEKMLKNRGGKVMSVAVIISAFVSLCSLFSAMDSLTKSLGFFGGFPLLSIVAILVVSNTSKYGINGLEKINSVLVPIVLFAVLLALAFKGDFKFTFEGEFSGVKSTKTVLFVTMNIFINLPVIFSSAKGKSKKTLLISAIISALILSLLTFFMLGAIAVGGEQTGQADMPLLSAVGGGYATLFAVALFTALASSVTTAYYPLYEVAKKLDDKRGVVMLGIISFAFSRLGLKTIVDYVYPIIGCFGLIYVVICLIYVVRKNISIKGKKKADNKIK